MRMDKKLDSFNSELMNFLDESPTPFHATSNMEKMLLENGYTALDECESWNLEVGHKYYVTRNNSAIIAFNYQAKNSYTMMGAHTDSPNLKVKPNPVITTQGTIQLGVEPYGGLLMNPWFDRDLSLAGRVVFSDENDGVHEVLIDFKRPLGIIASLAIHLDHDANKNRSINAQTDIVPLIGTGDTLNFDALLTEELIKEGYEPFTILSHELSFYDVQKAAYVGISNDFIASARLDNLLSCFVATKALIQNPEASLLMFCSDHEEVGSETTVGAAGPFLEDVLSRLTQSNQERIALVRQSFMLSLDNAHAIHPNFSTKHDANHAPKINEGIVIKVNANQRYASNALGISKFIIAAKKANAKYQKFVTRSDMGCGSTIGPITATRLGIETLDIGVPTYAMHSIREVAGSQDAYALLNIIFELLRAK